MVINLDRRFVSLLCITVLSSMTVTPGMTQEANTVQRPATRPLISQRQRPQPQRPTNPASTQKSPANRSSRGFAFAGKGAPASTVSGGRRNNGRCPQDTSLVADSAIAPTTVTQGLTALVPLSRFDGETIAERPTFLVYVPPTTARQLAFKLEDSDKEEVYSTRLNITGSSQIVDIRMQEPLQVGKRYFWTAALVCPESGPGDPFVEVSIKRVQPDNALANQLKQATDLFDQASLYAKAGLWYEAAAALFELRQPQPNDLDYVAAWRELLQSVDLDRMTTVPLRTAKRN